MKLSSAPPILKHGAPPPLRSAFCEFCLFFFWPHIMIICVLIRILYKKKSISMQLLESQIPPLIAAAHRMIICKRLATHFDNHKRAWKMHFWDPSQWDKMCFECQRIKLSKWPNWTMNSETHTFARPSKVFSSHYIGSWRVTCLKSNTVHFPKSNTENTILPVRTL